MSERSQIKIAITLLRTLGRFLVQTGLRHKPVNTKELETWKIRENTHGVRITVNRSLDLVLMFKDGVPETISVITFGLRAGKRITTEIDGRHWIVIQSAKTYQLRPFAKDGLIVESRLMPFVQGDSLNFTDW